MNFNPDVASRIARRWCKVLDVLNWLQNDDYSSDLASRIARRWWWWQILFNNFGDEINFYILKHYYFFFDFFTYKVALLHFLYYLMTSIFWLSDSSTP